MSKELEALQDLSKLVFIYGGGEQYKVIETALKALEIIKEKIKIEFNDHYFGIKDNYYIIVNGDVSGAIKVNKEQYELLKEILL